MADRLRGRTIAILATDGVEKVEFVKPREAVEQAGGTVEVLSLEAGDFQANDHLQPDGTLTADKAVSDANVDDYDGLIIPGGVANPDFLRNDAGAVRFVADFAKARKPIAAICHGPWVLVEAGIVKGRTITSFPSLQTDVRNAGGTWVDEEVHVESGLVTSRNPDDLPAFCDKLVEEFCEGPHDDMPQPEGEHRFARSGATA